ncbi:hypothetical protein WJX72_008244 [[Myrmecia] bisecta]|uniref:Uncharacterized protein n=1 Tax=[Myrmecia] bisecta TaxID=41462 RepID=A0AAW1PGV6_9CHLO
MALTRKTLRVCRLTLAISRREARLYRVVDVMRAALNKYGSAAALYATTSHASQICETDAIKKFRLCKQDFYGLHAEVRSNPHHRASAMRLYRLADVVAVARSKHGPSFRLQSKQPPTKRCR